MTATCVTANIEQRLLQEAAEAAVYRYQKAFDDDCAEARAKFAQKPQGFLFWKTLPTAEEVEDWFQRSDWCDGGGFRRGIFLDSAHRLATAERLLKIAETDGLTDIRLPEKDIRFLRKFLNNEMEA